ncbi:U6 snRNA phosphodiesterase [Lachnellula suecica]|uniref:U6 snRNA phosphodiesterase n=1 Tax=Lachnellula suecica TaxID=602035 RepID=A0A8T9CE57_9HELO|nr:U6 snRNA phosphodiesterase [Lachnellula suecica]
MALVDYLSSDEEGEEDKEPDTSIKDTTGKLKRKRDEDNNASDLPPLPSKFHDLYASTTRLSTKDHPTLHGGRKRVTPHVEGNWPSHLYIEWYPATAEHGSLSKLISSLKDKLPPGEATKAHSLLTSDLGAPLPLHISLSRPIGFATEQKDDFVSSLETAIKSSGIRPFVVTCSGLDWVANFEKTRWFLVLRIHKPDADGLNKLLHVCNSAVQDYGQPPLYAKGTATKGEGKAKSARGTIKGKMTNQFSSKAHWSDLQDVSDAFHISIAWTLGSPSQELLHSTESTSTDCFKDFAQARVNINEIKAKVGNAITSMPLQTNIQEAKGLFGF